MVIHNNNNYNKRDSCSNVVCNETQMSAFKGCSNGSSDSCSQCTARAQPKCVQKGADPDAYPRLLLPSIVALAASSLTIHSTHKRQEDMYCVRVVCSKAMLTPYRSYAIYDIESVCSSKCRVEMAEPECGVATPEVDHRRAHVHQPR
ncbi:hypothetical protein BG005_004338 [Podila minutissima]|nr:hypothetical protein BG005_004338 [Podila minutissima]